MTATATTMERDQMAAEFKAAMPKILKNVGSGGGTNTYLRKWQCTSAVTRDALILTLLETLLDTVDGWTTV